MCTVRINCRQYRTQHVFLSSVGCSTHTAKAWTAVPPALILPFFERKKKTSTKLAQKKYLGSNYGHTLTRTPRNPHKKKYLGPKTGHTYQPCIKTNPPEALTGNTTHAFL
jgi:hypothetical protein